MKVRKVEVVLREVMPAVPAVMEEQFILRLNREEAEMVLRVTGNIRVALLPEGYYADNRTGTWNKLYEAVGTVRTKYGDCDHYAQGAV